MKYIFMLLITILYLFSEDKIEINFKNLNLEELVNIVSTHTDKKILLTTKLKGKVDFISQKPISKDELFEVLKLSLSDNGYELKKSNSIYKVVKKSVKKTYNKKIKSKPISKNKSEIVYLKYLDSKDIKKLLDSIIKNRNYKKDKIPSISINEESNFLILDGKSEIIENLKEFIEKIDIAKEQIYIKTKIIEVDDNLVDEIGLKFGILGANVYSGGINSFSSNLNLGEAIPFDITNIGLTIPNLSSSLALGASINLLNKTYALNIISEPSILCINNKESEIYVGETVSIQTAATTTDGGTITNSFEREDIGLRLKVKPRVTDNNKVLINIETILEGIKNIDSTSSNPNTSKKLIKTTAIVNNGESVILGGLIENKNEKSIEKIPLAGDIPLIGELFKNRLNNNNSKNLTILITPYIVPYDKDLSFVREQLSKIQVFEDKLLEEVLKKLKKKSENKKVSEKRDLHKMQKKIIMGY